MEEGEGEPIWAANRLCNPVLHANLSSGDELLGDDAFVERMAGIEQQGKL